MWLRSGRECTVGSLRWGTGVNRGFGIDQIMRCQGNGRLCSGEQQAQLIGNIVSCEGRANDALSKHDTIVDGRDGRGRGANVNDKGRGFTSGEAGESNQLGNAGKRIASLR